MSVGAGPGAGAVALAGGDGPAAVGFELVVAGAECSEVREIAGSSCVPCGCVIDLASGGGAVAAGEAAVPVAGDDEFS